MNASTHEKLIVYVKDGDRVIPRNGEKLDEDADFLFILNERNQREGISKALIVRYVVISSTPRGPPSTQADGKPPMAERGRDQ